MSDMKKGVPFVDRRGDTVIILAKYPDSPTVEALIAALGQLPSGTRVYGDECAFEALVFNESSEVGGVLVRPANARLGSYSPPQTPEEEAAWEAKREAARVEARRVFDDRMKYIDSVTDPADAHKIAAFR